LIVCVKTIGVIFTMESVCLKLMKSSAVLKFICNSAS